MSDLPRGWAIASLSDLSVAIPAWNPKDHRGEFDYVDIEAIDNREQRVDTTKRLHATDAPSRARVIVRPGDVLFSLVRPYLKNIAIIPQLERVTVASTAFCRLRLPKGVESAFVFNFLRQDRVISSLPTYGSSPPAARDEEFFAQLVPLAPTKEQERIVAKLDELLSDLDAGVAALQRAQANLKRYRASVLKAAVEGRLTAEWRRQNPPTESGPDLLARLLRERRARWEKAQLTKFKVSEKTPPKGWREAYAEPPEPDASTLPVLPFGWCWATFEQLVARSEYGTSVKCSHDGSFQPVLRIPNIARGEIDLTDMKFATVSLSESVEDYLEPGDLLVCRTNGSIKLVGKCARVRSQLHPPHHFASYLLRFRLLETAALPAWICVLLSSMFGRRFVESVAASSAGQHNISLSVLHRMAIPLPPLAEAQQIVAKVDEAVAATERQDLDMHRAIGRACSLRQSILKHAFSGKLVPQDPNDEPASVLLERIRATRAAAPVKARAPRKTAARGTYPVPASATQVAGAPRKRERSRRAPG